MSRLGDVAVRVCAALVLTTGLLAPVEAAGAQAATGTVTDQASRLDTGSPAVPESTYDAAAYPDSAAPAPAVDAPVGPAALTSAPAAPVTSPVPTTTTSAPTASDTSTTPPPTTTPPTTTPPTTTTTPPAGTDRTAAREFGWGTPTQAEEFAGDLARWTLADGPGRDGNGSRIPGAVTVAGGHVTIAGDSAGITGGMAWNVGARYGRWEARVRAPVGDPSYNALLLLEPDAGNVPGGGEVDFVEMADSTRQRTSAALHYGATGDRIGGEVAVDATSWHNWAVEWTPTTITTYLDGRPWWSTSDSARFPPGPMHLAIRLDWFPEHGTGTVTPSRMEVDWVRSYPVGR